MSSDGRWLHLSVVDEVGEKEARTQVERGEVSSLRHSFSEGYGAAVLQKSLQGPFVKANGLSVKVKVKSYEGLALVERVSTRAVPNLATEGQSENRPPIPSLLPDDSVSMHCCWRYLS